MSVSFYLLKFPTFPDTLYYIGILGIVETKTLLNPMKSLVPVVFDAAVEAIVILLDFTCRLPSGEGVRVLTVA